MKTLRLEKIDMTATINGEQFNFPKINFATGEYKSGAYKLKIESGNYLSLKLVREDGEKFHLEHVSYEFSLPLRNFGKVIIPDSGRFFMEKLYPRLVWSFKFSSTGRALANPYICLLNMFDEVDFGFGLLGNIYESEFHFLSPGANRKNSLTVHGGVANAKLRWRVSFPTGGMPIGRVQEFSDGIFQSAGEMNWFQNLRKYGELYHQIHNLKYNIQDTGFRPALCTWRIINSDNMTHAWIIKTAGFAKKLGMKAIIFDDGWYGIGLDGQSLKSNMGDWPIRVKNKFDDIRKTIQAVKDIGIAPVLWYCPIGIGPHAKCKPEVEHLLSRVNGEIYIAPARFHTLCVRSPEARQVMVKNMLKLISYGAEGIKSDLFDYMPDEPCDATTHSHDCETTSEGIRRTFKLLYEEAMKARPDLIYSEKNNYGNVELAPDGSHVRGGDSPFDENINTLRSLYPAAYMPIVHNDYLAFSNFEEPQKVAILLIKQLTTGVPNFSLNLEKLSKRHAAVLKAWLGFFNENVDLYKKGTFEPQNPVMDAFQRVTPEKAMISLFTPGREITWINRPTVYILNASQHDLVYVNNPDQQKYRVEYFDHRLKLLDSETVLMDKLQIKAPSAGLTVFRCCNV